MKKRDKVKKSIDKMDGFIRMLFNVKKEKDKKISEDLEDLEDSSSVLKSTLRDISKRYEDTVVSYFSDRKLILDLSEECREMSKKLYEVGSLDSIRLLYPAYDDAQKITVDVYSLSGSGVGGTVMVRDASVLVLNGGRNFKLSDVIVGHVNNHVYIFQASSLKDVSANLQADSSSINWAMPLHTQLYRFFFPDSFDVSQIRATQAMIEEHGLVYVVQLYVASTLGLEKLLN